MADFDIAIVPVLQHEGGLSLDPNDSGNWTTGVVGKGELKGTNFGISAASFPSLDIKNLSLDVAKAIYKEKYWGPFSMLPQEVANEALDIAINSGVGEAQSLLNQASQVSISKNQEGNTEYLLAALRLAAIKHHLQITIKNDKMTRYLKSWISRDLS